MTSLLSAVGFSVMTLPCVICSLLSFKLSGKRSPGIFYENKSQYLNMAEVTQDRVLPQNAACVIMVII